MIIIPDKLRRPAEVERDELRKHLAEAQAEIENLKWHINSEKAKAEAALALNDRALGLVNEAQADAEHWKSECSDLVRMAHEMRAEIDYFQTLIDLQHKRTVEADKLWQIAHNQPDVLPDLGKLIEWLMGFVKICENCKHGESKVCYSPARPHNVECKGMFWERVIK